MIGEWLPEWEEYDLAAAQWVGRRVMSSDVPGSAIITVTSIRKSGLAFRPLFGLWVIRGIDDKGINRLTCSQWAVILPPHLP